MTGYYSRLLSCPGLRADPGDLQKESCSETRFNAVLQQNTRLLVQRNNSLPGAVLADFAPLGGAWCCFRLRLRLKDG
jgi:hypothetical protein